MDRVATKRRIILLLLDTLSNGFLVPRGEIFGRIFALFTGFGALYDNVFLHGLKVGERSEQTAAAPPCNSKVSLLFHGQFTAHPNFTRGSTLRGHYSGCLKFPSNYRPG